ncbi:MAG TPA: CBS domain-containing protein [Acidimicrobiia bacterium]|nr:CBS domain-containing protein [Acidimicrobiia bacterium]
MILRDLVGDAGHVCGPATTLADAARAMAAEGHGSLGVVEGLNLVGLVTERDLVRAISQDLDPATTPVTAVMTKDPDTFHPDDDVWEAAEWLAESGYRHLPVLEAGQLLGIVSVRDLLVALLAEDEAE